MSASPPRSSPSRALSPSSSPHLLSFPIADHHGWPREASARRTLPVRQPEKETDGLSSLVSAAMAARSSPPSGTGQPPSDPTLTPIPDLLAPPEAMAPSSCLVQRRCWSPPPVLVQNRTPTSSSFQIRPPLCSPSLVAFLPAPHLQPVFQAARTEQASVFSFVKFAPWYCSSSANPILDHKLLVAQLVSALYVDQGGPGFGSRFSQYFALPLLFLFMHTHSHLGLILPWAAAAMQSGPSMFYFVRCDLPFIQNLHSLQKLHVFEMKYITNYASD